MDILIYHSCRCADGLGKAGRLHNLVDCWFKPTWF